MVLSVDLTSCPRLGSKWNGAEKEKFSYLTLSSHVVQTTGRGLTVSLILSLLTDLLLLLFFHLLFQMHSPDFFVLGTLD